ncbi:uncharacterized protein LOC121984871 [Zingiber officinale]|uniref:uncharacterized protein LOC121984871 n=1 Tax=Zingiber officinale TaxID=94328 RepID=UPI001C4B9830|nr:uncharacterized protein LOC121984871 [Zingiber officinale]
MVILSFPFVFGNRFLHSFIVLVQIWLDLRDFPGFEAVLNLNERARRRVVQISLHLQNWKLLVLKALIHRGRRGASDILGIGYANCGNHKDNNDVGCFSSSIISLR